MLPVTFEVGVTIAAVFLCALAVKLTDDFLDRHIDAGIGRRNWAHSLGEGSFVYALLLLALAAGLNAQVSVPLFLASYCVGMFHNPDQLLPSRFRAWQECLVVFVAGCLLFSWPIMTFSVLFITAVQLMDDCFDYYKDALSGQRNLAHRFGMVECALMALIALCLAYLLEPLLFVPVLAGAALLYLCLLYKEALQW